jgi:hypothetical protein
MSTDGMVEAVKLFAKTEAILLVLKQLKQQIVLGSLHGKREKT